MLNDVQRIALGQPLDASRVKQREGAANRRLSYIETWDAKRAANEIFGYGNWGYEIAELADLGIETVTRERNGKRQEGHRVAYRCRLRLEVHGCLPVEDVGYGEDISYTSMLQLHELAAKEAVSDALKRALVAYGDQFGLGLYDKDAPEHKAAAPSSPSPPARRRTKPRAAQLHLLQAAKDAGVDDQLRHRITRMLTGHASTKTMTDQDCDRVTEQLAWFQLHREAGLAALEKWEAENGLA